MSDFCGMNTITMTKLARFVEMRLSKEFLDVEVEKSFDPLSHAFVMSIRAHLLSDSHMTISYPKNWKESLKERFMPNFLRRWFPVKYCTYEVWRVFPELPQSTRNMFGKNSTVVIPIPQEPSWREQ